MKRIITTVTLLVWTGFVLMADDALASVAMSLQECLVYARDHSTINVQARYGYEQQRIALQNSAMQFLPYISASANANIGFGRGIDPETNTYGTKQTLGTSFGVSMSLTDSVVYFTEIMPVEGAQIDGKTGFLIYRNYYSTELKDYMNLSENMPGRTSAVYYSNKRSKLEKKEAKLKKRLVEKQGLTVRYLGDKFKFIKP